MNQKESSFTLIELLVVIAIVGILAGILIVSMTGATNNANDARRKADINQIVKELLIYNTSNPAYPIETCSIGSNCSTALNTILGNAVNMKDPKGTFYTYSSTDGISFTISATLSNSNTYTYNSASSKYASNAGSSCISGGGLTCTETTVGNYKVNKYTLSGTTTGTFTWTVPDGVTQAEYLVVAGGGGGADTSGGGGGGGGVLNSSQSGISGSYTIVVGAGGACGVNGVNSSINFPVSVTSIGGGHGSGGTSSAAGANGGSGGGGAARTTAGSGGTGVSGQGTNGGAGWNSGSQSYTRGGGGGGAGAVGTSTSSSARGDGGSGLASSITGSSLYYGGGGGGGTESYDAGQGGLGGGGAGGRYPDTSAAQNGTVNTGGGGGGGYTTCGAGGSGVVIIKYLAP